MKYFCWFLWSPMACYCSQGKTEVLSNTVGMFLSSKCHSRSRDSENNCRYSYLPFSFPFALHSLTFVGTKACALFEPMKTAQRKHLYCEVTDIVMVVQQNHNVINYRSQRQGFGRYFKYWMKFIGEAIDSQR